MIKTRTYKNYLLAAALTVLFILECVTVMGKGGQADTWEDAYYMARDFVATREVMFLVSRWADFVLICFGVMGVIRFDKWDIAIMALIVLAQSITVFDYATNGNGRSVDVDLWAFGIVLGLIWIMKIFDVELIWNKLFNSRKTRR